MNQFAFSRQEVLAIHATAIAKFGGGSEGFATKES